MYWNTFKEFEEYLFDKGLGPFDENIPPYSTDIDIENSFLINSYYSLYLKMKNEFKFQQTQINQKTIKEYVEIVLPQVNELIKNNSYFYTFARTPASSFSYIEDNIIYNKAFAVSAYRTYYDYKTMSTNRRKILSESIKLNYDNFAFNTILSKRDLKKASSLNSDILLIPYCLDAQYLDKINNVFFFNLRISKILISKDVKLL
jgi:hypothetical protein